MEESKQHSISCSDAELSIFRRRELVRMGLYFPVETSFSVFLLVAVQYFHAQAHVKTLIAGAPFMGLMLSPFMVSLVARLGISVSKAIGGIYCLSGLGMIGVALSPSLNGFLTCFLVGTGIGSTSVPFVTEMWRHRVPSTMRGTLFSRLMFVGFSMQALCGAAIAAWLGDDIGRYRTIALFYAAALIAGGLACSRIKSHVPKRSVSNPVARLSLLWRDPFFGYMSALWMFFGAANLLTMPLRTEYIAAGRDFAAYSPFLVLLIVEVIPIVFRLLSVIGWGKLFDRLSFIIVRFLCSVLLGTSIILFFTPHWELQLLSAVLLGVARGGGTIAWNLWVTKYAPPERTAEYMSVHTFLTGVRGLIGPFIGFYLLTVTDFSTIAQTAGSVALVAALLLLPMMRVREQPS